MEQNQQITTLPAQTQPQKQPKNKNKKKIIKRAIIAVSVAAIVAVGGWFSFQSMNKSGNSMYDIAMNNIGEARRTVHVANDAGLTVEFITGIRETTFLKNGTATSPTAFALVSVTGGDNIRSHAQIDGMITVEGESHNFTLLQNPYNPLNFSYDIIKSFTREICCHDQIVVTLFLASNNQPSIALASTMTENCISWNDALKVAVEKLANELKGLTFEVYVTITHTGNVSTDAFWYVQFVTTCGQSFFCVVSSDGAVIG
jgi:hypothetical protein